MRKTVVAAAMGLALLLQMALPAGAVTGNFSPDFVHDYVGLLVTYDEDGEFAGRCSGTLLTPTVFLTAAHCTFEKASARVYMQQDAGKNYDPETGVDPVSGYPETGGITASVLHTYPGYDDFATFPNTGDVALVILDEPYRLDEYAALASAGTLDRLAKQRKSRHTFTVSGYGLSYVNGAKVTSTRERLMATVQLVNLRNALTRGYNLAHSGNPSQGKGGTCFGDSGGPVFLGTTDVIVAVTSFGLSAMTCGGPGFAYRTDQQQIIDWILSLIPDGQTVRVV